MLKPKRQKKCKAKGCNNTFSPMNSMQKVCSPGCALKFAKEKSVKEFNAETRKRKRKLKTRQEWLKEAQAAFNKYIRIRDSGLPCPSCGKSEAEVEAKSGWKVGGAWDAGHWLSRGARPQLRFNLLNTNRECKSCNGGGGKFSHKEHTKTQKYRASLVKKIGLDRVKSLEENNSEAKHDIEYAKRVKRIFTNRARLYKKLRGID